MCRLNQESSQVQLSQRLVILVPFIIFMSFTHNKKDNTSGINPRHLLCCVFTGSQIQMEANIFMKFSVECVCFFSNSPSGHGAHKA